MMGAVPFFPHKMNQKCKTTAVCIPDYSACVRANQLLVHSVCSYTLSRLHVITPGADAFYCSCSLKRSCVTLCRPVTGMCAAAGRPHDNHREERSVTLSENRSGIISPSFHPLTHCGTISVSKRHHPALQAPVPICPTLSPPCRTLSPRRCVLPRLHCSSSSSRVPGERNHHKGTSLYTSMVKRYSQCGNKFSCNEHTRYNH